MRGFASVLILFAAGTGLSVVPALAQHRRIVHRPAFVNEAPPLTVHRRSFLDPGNVVPVGTENSYVWATMEPHQDLMERGFGRSKFGNETLPGQFLPGRPEAIFEF